MRARRELEMELYILTSGSATMEELCERFGVSMNTVRRDVAALLKAGRIRKVYGGVQAAEGLRPIQDDYTREARAEEKRAICARAAAMVKDGDIVFIDAGTTTEHLIHELRDRKITIITNNITVLREGLEYENLRLIVAPGEAHRETRAITGNATAGFLSAMNTNIAFMTAAGVSLAGITESDALEDSIKRAAVTHTEKAVLLVTGDRFGVTSLFTYAQINRFQTVITDETADPEYLQKLEEMGVPVETVSVPGRKE